MSIIHGSMGLIYFVHQFAPTFDESALLTDKEMYSAVAQVNHQIAELAPVLNSPTVPDAATVASANADVPIAMMAKTPGDAIYLFAVAMRAGPTKAAFTVRGLSGSQRVEVLGEDRTIESKEGAFADDFKPWDVHLYRIGKKV